MGIHVTVDTQNKKTDMWMCLSSGCVRYYETEHDIYMAVEDTRKDGIRVEKSVKLLKRGNYNEVIDNIFNSKLTAFWNEAKADEGEMLEALKYIADKLKRGMKYVGVKLEYVSPRGLAVYFRLRYSEEGGRPYMNVDLVAEKDWEKLTYHAYGHVSVYSSLLEEAAKAVANYVLFSNFIYDQMSQQTEDRGGVQQAT